MMPDVYTSYNGEGFFPFPAFSWLVGRRNYDNVWVYITFSIVWGNRGIYWTYYRRITTEGRGEFGQEDK